MPTWERTARFDRDWDQIDSAERARFRRAAGHSVEDLKTGRFRRGLRVKGVGGTDGVFEMTWAPDGRATFEYGVSGPSSTHVIWRRIGRHEILRQP